MLGTGAFASSFTVLDPFGQPKCPPGVTTGCDVVGATTAFDFYRADVNTTATAATINLYFNFGGVGAANLAPFPVTANTTISVADLFLSVGGITYAIPLFNRTSAGFGNATAGTVYLANSPSAILTSDVVLNNPVDVYYRPGYGVWINTNQASVASVGSIAVGSGAVQGTQWMVTLNFSYAAGSALSNAMNDPGLHFFTGTATCANDLVENPEPSTWLMLSSGAALGLVGLRYRRSRK
jgi:hypothetical protein